MQQPERWWTVQKNGDVIPNLSATDYPRKIYFLADRYLRDKSKQVQFSCIKTDNDVVIVLTSVHCDVSGEKNGCSTNLQLISEELGKKKNSW